MPANVIEELPVGAIGPGPNDRKVFDPDELAHLAGSIVRHGLAQPITVRAVAGSPPYEIVAGERRWRAHQLAGLEQIRAIVVDYDDEEASSIMLLENLARVDLDPLAEASAYQQRIDSFGYSIEEMAAHAAKPASRVRARLRLLELVPEAQDLIRSGRMSLTYGNDLPDLTPARQQLAVRLFAESDLMPRGGWRALIRRLLKEQAEEAEEELFELKVDEYREVVASRPPQPGILAVVGLLFELEEELEAHGIPTEMADRVAAVRLAFAEDLASAGTRPGLPYAVTRAGPAARTCRFGTRLQAVAAAEEWVGAGTHGECVVIDPGGRRESFTPATLAAGRARRTG